MQRWIVERESGETVIINADRMAKNEDGSIVFEVNDRLIAYFPTSDIEAIYPLELQSPLPDIPTDPDPPPFDYVPPPEADEQHPKKPLPLATVVCETCGKEIHDPVYKELGECFNCRALGGGQDIPTHCSQCLHKFVDEEMRYYIDSSKETLCQLCYDRTMGTPPEHNED